MAEKCAKCTLVVGDNDLALECEICDKWFHISCINIGKTCYNAMKRNSSQGVHWYCSACDKVANNFIKKLSKLQEEHSKLEARVDVLEHDFSPTELKNKVEEMVNGELELKLGTIEAAMDQKIKEEIDNAVNIAVNLKFERVGPISTREDLDTAVKVAVDGKFENVGQSSAWRQPNANGENVGKDGRSFPGDPTEQAVKEIRDSENRKANIVIFKAAESEFEDIEDRKNYDFGIIKDLMALNKININRSCVGNIVRLGQRRAEGPRPLLVTFTSVEEKINFLKNTRSDLMSTSEKFKNVFVKHDMTLREKETSIKLGHLAKEKNEANQDQSFFFKVRGPPQNMRIVKVQRK